MLEILADASRVRTLIRRCRATFSRREKGKPLLCFDFLVAEPSAGRGGLHGSRRSGARPAGVADDHGGRVLRAAVVAQGEREVGAGGAAVGAVGDVFAAAGGGDGDGGLGLGDGQDRFVVGARAVAVAVFEHDPAVLPPEAGVAGDGVAARAQHDVGAVVDGAVACEVERGDQAVVGGARVAAGDDRAEGRHADGAQGGDDGGGEQEFDERDAALGFHAGLIRAATAEWGAAGWGDGAVGFGVEVAAEDGWDCGWVCWRFG